MKTILLISFLSISLVIVSCAKGSKEKIKLEPLAKFEYEDKQELVCKRRNHW